MTRLTTRRLVGAPHHAFERAPAALTTAVAALLLLAQPAWADNAVTIANGHLVRMQYASDGVTVQGTFDFNVTSIDSAPNTTGFLNVVADLDLSSSFSPEEWIIRNVPMFLDDGLTDQPMLSAWFEPAPNNISPGTPYLVFAAIEDAEITEATALAPPPSWDFSLLSAQVFTWGANDLAGQADNPTPSTGSSTELTGEKVASSKRKGVPDIAQQSMECGPTSTANSLRWLAGQHDFNDKLPAANDDLIKELMKAMTGSDARPFGGLSGNQLYDGKKQYIKDKKLPLVVKGGNADASASGGKAYDFIKKELDAGEDVEFLIGWPGGGSHWVTAIGYSANGDRLFLEVNDPDDGKTGAVEWELERDGDFVNPKGSMMWAVSESPLDPRTEYKTKPSTTSSPFVRATLTLEDDIELGEFDVIKPRAIYPPNGDSTGGPGNPFLHLFGYQIKPSSGEPKHIRRLGIPVSTDFGTVMVDTIKADRVLLPTAVHPLVSPPPLDPATHSLDAFKCYRIKLSAGSLPLTPGSTTEFADSVTELLFTYEIKKPQLLCFPVAIDGGNVNNPAASLFCAQIKKVSGQSKSPSVSGLEINNDLGDLTVDFRNAGKVCWPIEQP
ncbi:MAG: hypothetical protein HY899_08180 [Deltaproteobacteria bacterium]|nr:hypothetical protein [Deltaproteobacteria bacterium]